MLMVDVVLEMMAFKMKMFVVLVLGMLLVLAGCSNTTRGKIKTAMTHYDEGDYKTAFEKFGELLAQGITESWLHYNMGNAAYKQGDYEQAQKSYTEVLGAVSSDESKINIDYNMGNVFYRLGEQLESSDLEGALKAYGSALLQYKSVMDQDTDDLDVKFNYELTQKKLEELAEQLENQENIESSSDTGSEGTEEKDEESEEESREDSGYDEGEEGEGEESEREQQSGSDQDGQNEDGQDETQGVDEQAEDGQEDGGQEENDQDEQGAIGTSEGTEGGSESEDGQKQGMTLEEALKLLESMEHEEADHINIYVPDGRGNVEKDW
jgi:Ca-activated chloride channel family protein